MYFDKLINDLLSEDTLAGGLADKHTPESIAKLHNVPLKFIEDQIRKGIKVEYEHTHDTKIATEIALDHIFEIMDYYDRLEKMEKNAKKVDEMTSGEVVGTSGYGNDGGIAPQDNIPYARDPRNPTSLFGTKESKKKKKKGKGKKPLVLRRPKTGM